MSAELIVNPGEVIDAEFVSWNGTPVADSHTDEWYQARSTGIGASEAAAACGMSRYQTAYEVYCRKLGLIPEIEDNDLMWFGRELEPIVVKKFGIETGLEILQYPVPMLRHEKHPFMLATPDAMLANAEWLECKTTSGYAFRQWGEEDTDEVPQEYVFQAQQQLAVVGADVCWIAVLVDGRKLHRYRVERNDKLIEQIVKRESELWDRIQNQDPPEPDWRHPSTVDLMKRVHRDMTDEAIVLSNDLAKVRRERDEIAEQAKRLKLEMDARDAKILAAIGDNALAIFEADEEGFPCEFEIVRSWVEPTTYPVNRKGYYTLRKRKSK